MVRFYSFLVILLVGCMAQLSLAANDTYRSTIPEKGPVRPAVTNPHTANRVHNAGRMWMNITNYGYFGNDAPSRTTALDDPCNGLWAPQCEFPGGSGQQYLYMAALWIGALIVEEGYETKRVSVGSDGWDPDINEMYPGEGANDGIEERSTRPGYYNCFGTYVSHPDAVSDQDFLCAYSDTLTDPFWLNDDREDGPHRPLGVKVTQTSYSFSQNFAQDFILIDYEFENIASNYLKNLYVGLYVDSDVGHVNEQPDWHQDDICGFLQYFYFDRPNGDPDSVAIDVAWIADNDGRGYNDPPGSADFRSPNVAGTRVIRAPNPRLETSFNWWISNSDVSLDFGPAWAAYAERDSNGGGWTGPYGTPMGDERKYFVLSNEEFDYDQVYVDDPDWIRAHCQEWVNPGTRDTVCQDWAIPDATNPQDLANGYDTRYLLSWGPLGVRDYQDFSGRWIYRLNPGEKFNMTIAYVAGENFHNVNHPQPNPEDIDPTLFDFTDLRTNARWAKVVYDNPMRDTYQWDWGNDHDVTINDEDGSQGDGILETGDGWFGEDVGTDGLYGIIPAGAGSVAVWYFKGTTEQVFAGYYYGPDADGTERNGRIDLVNNPNLGANITEDNIIPIDLIYSHPKYRYWDQGWMSGNGRMDEGDGLPDFTGPPPPPIPALQHPYPNTRNAAEIVGGIVTTSGATGGLGFEIRDNNVIIRWSKKPSEDPNYVDPFSLVQDFEGYSIYQSTGDDYSPLAIFDKKDWAYFAAHNDSMATVPLEDPIPPGDPPEYEKYIGGVRCIWGPVGPNTGFDAIRIDDSTYQYTVPNQQPLWPRYYSVTAFDFGDPKSGLGPLETPVNANAVLLAPAGNPGKKVRVVPNPYRAYLDYTMEHSTGLSWENQNDGTVDFYPQTDRRIEFINLPLKCLIRIFTVSGDMVAIVPHNVAGDDSRWVSDYSEKWDLNSRNVQQVVSGLYLFSVEDKTEENSGHLEVGKFVIIR